ncbi:hypothetical protein D3870_13395 [Noviherbaspirillum cavernae]|uniref:Uncharacterized protein n=2 Tax=Noviherbaspirillum cavernae TaxID=2320862 RepID=A0A418X399_9BURK|nr:hypothetical protein D3870_13395 [Noviherbaspirillum cavernae]
MMVLAMAALLAACTTPEQRAQYMAKEADYMMQVYGPACDKLGYARDTDRWRDCILRLSTRDDLVRSGGYIGYGYPIYRAY